MRRRERETKGERDEERETKGERDEGSERCGWGMGERERKKRGGGGGGGDNLFQRGINYSGIIYSEDKLFRNRSTCPEISDIHRRLYIEKSCKVFDFFQT